MRRAQLQEQQADLMRAHGPIPRKSGGGELVEVVLWLAKGEGLNPSSKSETSWGGKYSSRSIWSKTDHTVTHKIPYDCELRLIGGVITCTKIRNRHDSVAPCWWPEKSVGYSCNWVAGWLVRGFHVASGTRANAIARERRMRRKQHRNYWKAKHAKQIAALPLQHRWLTFSDSLQAGNCEAGTLRAAERVANTLGIPVDQLREGVAVRADVVRDILTDQPYLITKCLDAAALAGH